MDWSINKQLVNNEKKDVNKMIKHGLDQTKFPTMLEPILWNNVFCQELQDPNLILLMVQIR